MAKLYLLIPHYAEGTLSAEFGSSDTTAESDEFIGLPAVGTDEFYRLTLDPDSENGTPEVIDFPTHSGSSDQMTCTVATDRGREQYAGSGAARTHPVGTKWRFVLTAGILAGDSDFKVRVEAASISLAASTAWKDTDNTRLDMQLLGVEIGHRVRAGGNWQWGNEAVAGFADFVSVVSGSPVNGWGQQGAENGSNFGIMGLRGNASVPGPVGADVTKIIVSGDLTTGNILNLRLRARQETATAKTLGNAATVPIIVEAYNMGWKRKYVVFTPPES